MFALLDKRRWMKQRCASISGIVAIVLFALIFTLCMGALLIFGKRPAPQRTAGALMPEAFLRPPAVPARSVFIERPRRRRTGFSR